MKKTVGKLQIHDLLYQPEIGAIKRFQVQAIRVISDGIEVTSSVYTRPFAPAPFIGNKIHSDYYGFDLYANIEDAIEKQRELRAQRLKELQNNLKKAIEDLNWFTSRYFQITPENTES